MHIESFLPLTELVYQGSTQPSVLKASVYILTCNNSIQWLMGTVMCYFFILEMHNKVKRKSTMHMDCTSSIGGRNSSQQCGSHEDFSAELRVKGKCSSPGFILHFKGQHQITISFYCYHYIVTRLIATAMFKGQITCEEKILQERFYNSKALFIAQFEESPTLDV